jgi:hypothetical protein
MKQRDAQRYQIRQHNVPKRQQRSLQLTIRMKYQKFRFFAFSVDGYSRYFVPLISP